MNISQRPTGTYHKITNLWYSVLQGHITKELCPGSPFYRNTSQKNCSMTVCSTGTHNKSLCPDSVFYRKTSQKNYSLRICSKWTYHNVLQEHINKRTVPWQCVLQEHITKAYALIVCSTVKNHKRTIPWESVLSEHITMSYRNTSQNNHSLIPCSTGTHDKRTMPW